MPDILDNTTYRPALTATSDMPVIEVTPPPEPAPEPVADPAPAPEPEADPAPEPEPSEPEGEAAPAPQKGIARRFSELTTAQKVEAAKREAAEEYSRKLEDSNAELRKLLAESIKKPETPAEPVPEPPPPVQARPRREDFVDPDSYDAAVDEWNDARQDRRDAIREAERAHNEKAQKEEAERATAEREQEAQLRSAQEAWQDRRAKAVEVHPDFVEVVEGWNWSCTPAMGEAIMSEPNGADIAYHLASNPDDAAKIAALPPIRQFLEIGKLAASLTQPEAPEPRVEAPRAPRPVSPVRRGNGPATTRTLEEIGNEGTVDDYAAVRGKQLRDARGSAGFFGGRTQ